nr:MAG TPA: hypothetical protein [Caudoviricetes sp.]
MSINHTNRRQIAWIVRGWRSLLKVARLQR